MTFDKKCQTISLLGDRKCLLPLIKSGIKGVNRVVGIGKTMYFSLIWDGYDMVRSLTRVVTI